MPTMGIMVNSRICFFPEFSLIDAMVGAGNVLAQGLLLGALAGVLGSAAPLWGKEESPPTRPNVLFLIADDLNCYLGAYGHPLAKTPNIDRLAGRGVLFERAYCNQPLCGPSRASLMTGLYPAQSNVRGNAILIRDRAPGVKTLSQHFMDSGYRAVRIGKIYHYNNPKDIGTPGHDDPASWSETRNPSGRDKREEDLIIKTQSEASLGGSLCWLAAEGTDEEQTDGMVATEAIGFLEKFKASGEPFFLAVGFYKPHTPYVAPKKYFEMYDKERINLPEVPSGYEATLPEAARKTIHKMPQVDDESKRAATRAYLATISFLDAQVGRVLDALDRLGLAEETIVVFTSDHGYHLGEHGHFQKNTLFESAARVPLVFAFPPRVAQAARTKSLAELIDLYRTLSDLAGISAPPDYVQGTSLAPVLADPSASLPRDSAFTTLSNLKKGAYTLRTPTHRFTRWGDGGPGMIELYDHATDPEEMKNLANDPAFAPLVKKMEAGILERISAATTVPEGVEVLDPPPGKKRRQDK